MTGNVIFHYIKIVFQSYWLFLSHNDLFYYVKYLFPFVTERKGFEVTLFEIRYALFKTNVVKIFDEFFFQNKIVQLIDANIILRTCMITKYQLCTIDVGFCVEQKISMI